MALLLTKSSVKRKRAENEETINACILCNERCSENRSNYDLEKWEDLRKTAEKWKGLDTFGDVFDNVNWSRGPSGIYFHKLCRLRLNDDRRLKQAIGRNTDKTSPVNNTILQDIPCASASADTPMRTRSQGVLHQKDLCVWCMNPKWDDKNKTKKNDPFRLIETESTWNRFKHHIVFIDDQDLRQRLIALIDCTPDPWATEIPYHESCMKHYLRPTYDLSDARTLNIHNVSLPVIRQLFFKHIRKTIVEYNEPRTLRSLLSDYELIANNSGITVGTIKTSYIKELVEKEFKDELGFHERYHHNQSTIVFKRGEGGSFIEAALYSWGISDEQIVNTAARRLKEHLKENKGPSWPPSVEDMEKDEKPNLLLYKFVCWLRNPADKDFASDPGAATLTSLIESRITNKRTLLKERIAAFIHGLTRNREILDLLKKLDVIGSYDDIKNLYATWAYHDLVNRSSLREIADNFPGTAIVDNDDFQDDTLTGANTSHRTNVMLVQPESMISSSENGQKPVLAKHKDLSDLVEENNKVTPYKTTTVGVPPIREEIEVSACSTDPIRQEEMIHTLAKIDASYENIEPNDQEIGSFSGFQSTIRSAAPKSKPYYYLTLPKPPHKSVVNEVMNRMVEVAEEKNMPFIQLVGDQPVYTLIVQLRNENNLKFKKILPILGPFHCQLSFINVIRKRFSGSGLSELIVSTDIIADKSVDQAFRAKHYHRILRALQLTYEALQRRIVRIGVEEGLELSAEIQSALELLRHPSKHSKAELQNAMDVIRNATEFHEFIERAYGIIKDYNSPLADYWLSYMELVEILMMIIHALKTQNWMMFKESIRMMIPWMKIYDNNKYGKWLVEFWAEMSTLSPDMDAYMVNGLFSQSMTGNSYSCLPLDLWIEMTMNKGSKMKSGWKSILKNENMLLTHTLTANYVNRVRVSLHSFANMKKSASVHRENTTKRKNLDEKSTQDIDECLIEFDCDPFSQHETQLRTLHSGQLADPTLQNDFATASADGELQFQDFLKKRCFSRTEPFDSTIHRNDRKKFLTPVVEKTAKVSKSAAMENEAMCKVVSLCCQENISLSSIMEYRITEECLTYFNMNGSLVKTQKSKMKEFLVFEPLPYEKLRSYIVLVDMGFMWRLCTPAKEDREQKDEQDYTWGDYAVKIYETMVSRHKHATTFVLVNDPYDVEENIKDSEHETRKENYQGGSKNVVIKANGKFPSPREFNEFFTNKKNKMRLQDFLKKELSVLATKNRVDMIYSVQSKCHNLQNNERLEQFECIKSEADQILFFVYSQIRRGGIHDTVVIDAEDTDVIVLSARVSHEINGDLGIKWKKNIFECEKLCSPELAKVILQLYYHTGADAVSAFFGRGKKSVMKNALKFPDIAQSLESVGTSVPISNSSMDTLRVCTIKLVYNDKRSKTLAEARVSKWNGMKKKNPSCDYLQTRIPTDFIATV